MNIPYSQIKAQFRELADDITEEINATSVDLYFVPTQNGGTTINFNSLSYDVFGNPVPTDVISSSEQSGSQQIVSPVIETITCRVYWDPKDISPSLREEAKIKGDKSICKINAYTTDIEKLRGATYILVNGIKCVCLRKPIPYGLMGDKFYCQSYWQAMI